MGSDAKRVFPSLETFLDSSTSWADAVDDHEDMMPTEPAPAPSERSASPPPPRADRSFSPPRRPLPTEPPFSLYVGNLSYKCTEGDLRSLFGDDAVESIRLISEGPSGRFKGFGYVDFVSQDAMAQALRLSGQVFMGRPINVDVCQQKQHDRDHRSSSSKFGRSFNKPTSRESAPPPAAQPQERRRLQLQPRTLPLPEPVAAPEPKQRPAHDRERPVRVEKPAVEPVRGHNSKYQGPAHHRGARETGASEEREAPRLARDGRSSGRGGLRGARRGGGPGRDVASRQAGHSDDAPPMRKPDANHGSKRSNRATPAAEQVPAAVASRNLFDLLDDDCNEN